jgi:hypothetical protein
MSEIVVLSFIAGAGLVTLGTIAIIGFVIKLLFWAVLFPIRLALKLVFGVLGIGLAALVLPIVFVIAGVAIVGAIVAALFAIVAPLLPVLLLCFVGWAIYRASSRRPSPVI